MPGEAGELSPCRTRGSLAPAFHHRTDKPNHPLQPELGAALPRPLLGSAHGLTAIRGWILTGLVSVLEKNSY